jgi:integrase
VTPHSLRRTFARLRYVVGDDPITVGEQGGWSDPSFPMKVYARAVKRREKLDGAALEQFDAALQWAQIGIKRETAPERTSPIGDAETSKRRSRAGN